MVRKQTGAQATAGQARAGQPMVWELNWACAPDWAALAQVAGWGSLPSLLCPFLRVLLG